MSKLPANKDREYVCPECNRRVTKGKTGLEYGHDKGVHTKGKGPCPRRPAEVNSSKPSAD